MSTDYNNIIPSETVEKFRNKDLTIRPTTFSGGGNNGQMLYLNQKMVEPQNELIEPENNLYLDLVQMVQLSDLLTELEHYSPTEWKHARELARRDRCARRERAIQEQMEAKDTRIAELQAELAELQAE